MLGAVGSGIDFDIRNLEVLPGVQEVHRISSPYKLAGRSFRPEGTIVKLANGIGIGGNEIVVMAGPCSVESREQILRPRKPWRRRARKYCAAGRSSRAVRLIVSGMGEDGLKMMREAGEKFKLLVISEVMEIRRSR